MSNLIKICKKLFFDNLYLIFLIFLISLFFYPFFLYGKIPIPADTIVGMYHPYRDVIWNNQITGIPFKNFLITDPVRQQFVWRRLCLQEFQKGSLPVWNPYSFSGTPLLANFQSACFYPLNILFFLIPFDTAWGFLVYLQPLLAGIFLFYYLRFLKVSQLASLLGSFTFAFCGFSIAWLEWNTIFHTVLWLPLILFSIEKLLFWIDYSNNLALKKSKLLIFSIIFVFSNIASFFAGHLQVFFYCFIISFFYLLLKFFYPIKDKHKALSIFIFCYLLFFIISALQWLPTAKFIFLSAREFDQSNINQIGWFIPYQNLIQFIAPDFFGNPATNNYWGIWNYGEFIGYIGILPLFFAIYAILFRFDKKITFFGSLLFIGLLFSFPTPLAKLPYIWKIPFLSTSQPTRLIFVVDFALSVLAALGFDFFLKQKSLKKTMILLISMISVMVILWCTVYLYQQFRLPIDFDNIIVSRRNLIFPTFILLSSTFFLLIFLKIKKATKLSSVILLILLFFDLFRFAGKFTPFSLKTWIFPTTNVIETLKNDLGIWRLLSLDRRIMPPNFSVYYHLQDIAGYDPLYLKKYGELVSVWEAGKAEHTTTSFNRIITPQKIDYLFLNLLGVKYILNFGEISSQDLQFVLSEGMTYLYRNPNAFPRFFLVEEVIGANSNKDVLEKMFSLKNRLRQVAVTDEEINIDTQRILSDESIDIISYNPGKILLKTKTNFKRFLVITNIFYPSWKAYIDGRREKIYQTDYAFQGIIVPAGQHEIELNMGIL